MFKSLKKLAFKLRLIIHRVIFNSEHNWLMFKHWLHYRIHELKFRLNTTHPEEKKIESLKRSHIMYVDFLHILSENKCNIAQKLKLSTQEELVLCDVIKACQHGTNRLKTNLYNNKFGPYYAVGHSLSKVDIPDQDYEHILSKLLYQVDTNQKIESSVDVRRRLTDTSLELLFMMFRVKPCQSNIHELFNASSIPNFNVHYYKKDDIIRYTKKCITHDKELISNCTLNYIGIMETETEGKLYVYGCNERINKHFSSNKLEKTSNQFVVN